MEELLKYSLEFLRKNDFNKIISIKKLDNNQKHFLKTSFPLFINDIEEYGYEKEIPLEIMTDYFAEEMEKMEFNENIDPESRTNELVLQIEGFVKNLRGNDFVNYVEVMEKIIKLDYRWSKYVIDKKYRS